MMDPVDVVITGIGPVLPGCGDRETLWTQLVQGSSQLTLEPVPGCPERYAMGRVAPLDAAELSSLVPARFFARYPRDIQHYLASIARACRDARLDLGAVPAERVGLFDGSSRGPFGYWLERLGAAPGARDAGYGTSDLIHGTPGQAASIAAALLRIEGPVLTVANTCSSGAVAIGHAYREIALGNVDVAFGTGHDAALIAPIYHMYEGASLLNQERAEPGRALRPYGGNFKNVFGEGAITLVLERREHAERRGAPILARLAGHAYGNTGRHPTHVDASGERPARLITSLLARAAVAPAQVDVVVGHGNGMRASDESERMYMRRVFAEHAGRIPLISVKPIYGHLLGASSALNVAALALMVANDQTIGTLNAPEQSDGVRHQPAGRAGCRLGLAMSFGIGGHNTAVLVRGAF